MIKNYKARIKSKIVNIKNPKNYTHDLTTPLVQYFEIVELLAQVHPFKFRILMKCKFLPLKNFQKWIKILILFHQMTKNSNVLACKKRLLNF